MAAVSGQLLTFAATDNDDHVIAFGWPEDSFFWSSVPLAEGHLPQPGERKFALVGKDIANTLGKHIGDEITLLGDKFHIIALTNYTSVINRNALIASLPDLQEATFRTGSVTLIAVRLADPADQAASDRVAKAIESLGEFSVTRSESMLKKRQPRWSAVSSSMAWVALLMGVLMVLNTLLMAVLERTREIGIRHIVGDRLVQRAHHGCADDRGIPAVSLGQRARHRARHRRLAALERDPSHWPLCPHEGPHQDS